MRGSKNPLSLAWVVSMLFVVVAIGVPQPEEHAVSGPSAATGDVAHWRQDVDSVLRRPPLPVRVLLADNSDRFKELIQTRAAANRRYAGDLTLLHIAAVYGPSDVVNSLLVVPSPD